LERALASDAEEGKVARSRLVAEKKMHVDASESVFTLANGWEEFMCGV
jgi:hypothetical protein